ncbi:MAG: ABC transporter substrate-binding protein [Lentisphaerae bacterium]|nr:ABC transporter substrate-binding protein [Lentisphaerota bacterium]
MMSCRHVLPVLTLALLAGLGGTARGAEADPALARAQIRETSEKVLEIFRTRELFAPEASDRLLAELRAVLDQRFDWPTMARWVLGRKRPLFDEAQTGEFADLFSQYVVLYYLTQVEQQIVTGDPDQVNQVRIDYRDGTSQADGSVALEVIFTTPKGTTVQTGYTLVFDAAGAAWRVRNFSVEGVSLVRNWRNELASARSREQIMELMTRKVDELRARRAAAPAAKP